MARVKIFRSEVRQTAAIPTDWAWLDAIAGKLDDDFVDAALEDVPQQERPALKKRFP